MASDPIIEAGIKVAGSLLEKVVAEVFTGSHDVAAAVVNGTPHHMTLIPGIHTHHGQYTQAPAPTLGKLPQSVDDEKSVHQNIVVVSVEAVVKGTGGAAETIFGYEFVHGGRTYQLCFYLKHGHHLESGSALWEKGKKVDGEDYSGKIHKAAESLIHTIQKKRSQTSYSKDGEGALVEVDGIKVSHSSGRTFQFLIEAA